MKQTKTNHLALLPLAAIALFPSIRAELANGGFETDAIGAGKYKPMTPASWTAFGTGAPYVVEGAALGGVTGGHGGSRYFLAHAQAGGVSAIRQDSAITWASLAPGDTLTVTAWTNHRNDVSGAARTHFWLNDSDASGLHSPPMDVTDTPAGTWTKREWSHAVTLELIDRAAAENWGPVEAQVGIIWKEGAKDQQVAFDDVSLTLTRATPVVTAPAAKLPATPVAVSKPKSGLSFNRDIRPILSENCFHCHGQDPEHRGGDLRLDIREEAVAVRDGIAAIVPGDPEKSEIIKRIVSKDPDMVMPPPDAHMPAMPSAQIETLKKWIREGAVYELHWSFVPPKKAAIPAGANPVDHFVDERLAAEKIPANGAADDATLVRRLHLDLTGLPPSPAETDAILADTSADRWQKLTERLMASTAFAERMAIPWLDGARYSDTHGYSIDDHRDMWAWRDWVINAFHKNQPYDQFVREQIAGDLIPNATPDQIAATGFLRNSMNTHEGGTIAEEYRVNYTVDKVDAVSTSILGLTMKCAQCHDHKYDPISQKEFFQMYAFFNTSSEPGKGATNASTPPVMNYKSPLGDGGMAQLKARVAELEHFRDNHPSELTPRLNELKKSIEAEIKALKLDIDRGHTSVMVMDHKPELRKTHILIRGAYDQPGEEVRPGTPSALPPMAAAENPTRLHLAEWITKPDHPLTSRVIVNRVWQMVFGRGLVETAGDFGNQGSWPSHPELLDWLAADLVENNWDLRHLIRTILSSQTYRRSAAISAEQLEKDPRNLLLARSPRTRLDAEILRDQALAVGGLLNATVGGPSVHPPQHDLWSEISHFGYVPAFTSQIFIPGKGASNYRRSLYTFWKRTSPPPVMSIFDAPTRETCAIIRSNTNTPLQALVLLNEPQFVEAGNALGRRMVSEGGPSPDSRLTHGFRLATGRIPASNELAILKAALERNLSEGKTEPEAYAALGSTLLNLDEFINRP